jgi:hypothetical protein
MWKETVIVKFEALSWNLAEETVEDHEQCQLDVYIDPYICGIMTEVDM